MKYVCIKDFTLKTETLFPYIKKDILYKFIKDMVYDISEMNFSHIHGKSTINGTTLNLTHIAFEDLNDVNIKNVHVHNTKNYYINDEQMKNFESLREHNLKKII